MEKLKEPTFLFLLSNFAGGQRYAKGFGLVIYVILAWPFFILGKGYPLFFLSP